MHANTLPDTYPRRHRVTWRAKCTRGPRRRTLPRSACWVWHTNPTWMTSVRRRQTKYWRSYIIWAATRSNTTIRTSSLGWLRECVTVGVFSMILCLFGCVCRVETNTSVFSQKRLGRIHTAFSLPHMTGGHAPRHRQLGGCVNYCHTARSVQGQALQQTHLFWNWRTAVVTRERRPAPKIQCII